MPLPTEWKKESIDLSTLDNFSDALIRFKATAGNGWGYFLDDVNVASATATEELGIINSMAVTPNPAKDKFVIKINSMEDADAMILLTDLSGKNLIQLKKNLISGYNELNIPVSQNPGIYLLEVKTKSGVISQKVTILN